MSGAAGALDLRYPIGGLFAVLGVMLTAWGLVTNGDPSMYSRSANVNINLWWGLVMLAVGIVFLLLARRGSSAARPAMQSPEGRATERREHDTGLER